jgi:aminopeptidase N
MIRTNRLHFFIFSLFFTLFSISVYAQRVDKKWHDDLSCRSTTSIRELTDETYDVKLYHIDVEISITVEYIKGSVYIVADAVEELSTITLDLDDAYTINSIDGASSYTFSGNEIVVTLENPVLAGEEFTLKVYYEGDPPLAGGYKGLRYETHDGGEPIIASLSTPYLAHTWWPCNDGTKDKADTVLIDITIDDMMVSGIQMQAISNGVLDEVEIVAGGKLKYKWIHNYPIVPYYVMVAISNYQLIEQMYDNGSESFPLKYYVFDSSVSQATNGVAELPDVMDFFTTVFGPYPFADEKYGMTQLGFYGGIENQTNTIINNMGLSWFMVSVHELAHMWFADMITCYDWHHGWLNEGFATYAEALWIENSEGMAEYHNYVEDFEFYSGGSIYMEDVSDPFSVFQSIIYDKGAYTLHMLRHVLGDAVFFESIEEYASDIDFQYGLATTEDLKQVCEDISGKDLSSFFNQWIYDEYYPKYTYDYIQDGDFNTVLGILQTQENNGWRSVFEMPIDVKFEFSDGTDTTLVVQNDAVFQTFGFEFTKEISSVTIDPDKWILKNAISGDLNLSVDENILEKSLVIYPNPVKEFFTIYNSSNSNITSIKLYDVLGRMVLDKKGDVKQIEVSHLNGGVLFVEIETEKGIITKKIIKN